MLQRMQLVLAHREGLKLFYAGSPTSELLVMLLRSTRVISGLESGPVTICQLFQLVRTSFWSAVTLGNVLVVVSCPYVPSLYCFLTSFNLPPTIWYLGLSLHGERLCCSTFSI